MKLSDLEAQTLRDLLATIRFPYVGRKRHALMRIWRKLQ